MIDRDAEQVMKGGVCWAEMSFSRGPKGLEFWIKTVPDIENFVKSMGNGAKDNITVYGRDWFALNKPIELWRAEKDIQGNSYTITHPTEPLKSASNKYPGQYTINLSFLRIVGISNPEGVRFGIAGPFSKSYVRELTGELGASVKELVRSYIAPLNINLRISSTEL